MAPTAPVPPDSAAPEGLLQTLLQVSLTGIILFRPVFSPNDAATIVDLAYVQLNPAAQRMLRLPECPADSFLTLYPKAIDTGIFAFYRDTFRAGTAGRHDVNYQHDGLDNYFQLAAQRHGELLVVSFSDTADQPRTAVEEALRQSQAREQQARAEAEAGRQRLHDILTQLPAQVAVNRGPAHVYELVNPRYQQQFPARAILGRPVREALPELEGQQFFELLDQVYQTGEPFYGHEIPAEVDYAGAGRMEQRFFNVFFQALRDARGRVDGLLNFAYDVTEQVRARREVERLNQELEARVFERTQALRHAQAEAVAAAQRLRHVTNSLPSTSFTVDQSGQVLHISPQWYAYTGMVPGTDINEAWPTLIHPDDLPAIAREFGAALTEGRPWRYEFRLRGTDGAYRWFASQGVPEPLAEAAGRSRQWFGSNLDIDELQQARHALEQQDRRLRELLLQSPAMIAALTGPEHRFAFTNPGYDALVGHRAAVGRSVAECLPEVVGQGFIDLLDQVYRTGEPHLGHETLIALQPPGGEPTAHYLDFTYQPLRDADGQTTGVQVFVLDVTERVRARQRAEALQAELLAAAERQAQERAAFHEVFEQTPACIALLRGPTHRFEYVNQAYQDLFPGRELVGQALARALPDAADQGFVALLDGVYRTGEAFFGNELPLAITQPDGRPPRQAYFTFTYQVYREHGQVVGISIFAFDVAEQVHARQERAAQQQQLRDMFEQAPVAICVFGGPTHTLDVINPSMAAIMGRPLAQLVGQPLLAALPEIADQGFVALLDQVRETRVPYLAHEQQVHWLRNGQPYTGYLDYVYQPLHDAQGAVVGVVWVAVEVTEQVHARQQVLDTNQALSAANEQLTRTNVDLDNFIYTASHDLKAPISNIEGLLNTLRDELPPQDAGGEVPYILELMQDSVNRFTRTIEHLTDVSRLQKEHNPPQEPVPLAGVIEDVRLDLAPLLRQTGGRLDIAVRAVPTVQFSVKNLRSVVYNLLSNALKYHHPDRAPLVQVRARTEGAYQVLEVQDNGLGLDLTREPELFGMFRRYHTHVDGSGIGLYMVKRMLENTGGRIEVRSTLGEGSTFTVYFPAPQAIS